MQQLPLILVNAKEVVQAFHHNCDNSAAGLYCCTQPSISGCSDVRFGCWMGAYPMLTAHFAAANLDPQANNWDKVVIHQAINLHLLSLGLIRGVIIYLVTQHSDLVACIAWTQTEV